MPRSLFPLVIGWIGLFAVCAIVPDRAFSAPDPLEAPAVYSSGRVLHVGPARRLKTPSEAAIVAQRGDAIRIDAGNYFDCAAWRTPDITLIGEGPGYAHIQDISCDGKALWVFYDGPVRIENIRFSGAKVAAATAPVSAGKGAAGWLSTGRNSTGTRWRS